MTAGKLPMPGLRARISEEEEEDAGPGRGRILSPKSQQRQNENGSAAVATGEQYRCSNSSSQAGLASSVMQPLPLASRYVGASKYDSVHHASSALGSSWIRRFIPSAQEVARVPKPVWEGGGAVYFSQPSGPLLLPSELNDLREVAMGTSRMGLESSKEISCKGSGNVECSMQNGNVLQRKSSKGRSIASHDLGDYGVKSSLQNVNALSSQLGTYVVEGSNSLQQSEGKHAAMLFMRGESLSNGASGALVAGFGPLRVVTKTPTSDHGKVVESGPKLRGLEGEIRRDVDVSGSHSAAYRLSNLAFPDHKPNGTQPSTKFTSLSISKLLEDPWSGRPCRAVEFADSSGFARPKKEEVEPDDGRLVIVHSHGGTETAAVSGGSNAGERPSRLSPVRKGDFRCRLESGPQKFLDSEMGIEREKMGSGQFCKRFVSSCLPSNLGRKEDGGQASENRFVSGSAEGASANPDCGGGCPGGTVNRKMKEIVGCGFSSRRCTDTGRSQGQHFKEIYAYASSQFQGDMCIGKKGHPLPFSLHSSFPGSGNSGEEAWSAKYRASPAKCPRTSVFGNPKSYDDVLDGRGGRSQQEALWTSLFTAFKDQNLVEPVRSTFSSATLPLGVHSRLPDGCIPANCFSEYPKVNGYYEETSGEGRRNDAQLPTSGKTRSRFENESSHFSSCPWPDNDGGFGPYQSQAAGSAHHSQASRVVNRSFWDCKGKFLRADMNDKGGYDTPAGSKESYASEQNLRKYAGSQGGDNQQQQQQQQQTSNGVVKGQPLSMPLKCLDLQTKAEHKDDSDSSPPSYPLGYNSSDVGSQVLPIGIVREHLGNIASKLKNVEVDAEVAGREVPEMQKGYMREIAGFNLKGRTENVKPPQQDNGTINRSQKDVMALPCKDLDSQRDQPTAREVGKLIRHGSSMEGEVLLRHGRLRMSCEAMGEGGISGPSNRKRSRHHPTTSSLYLGTQMAGSGQLSRDEGVKDGAGKASSWLKRWLPPASGDSAKPSKYLGRPKDICRTGLNFESPRSTGNISHLRLANDQSTQAKSVAAANRGKEIDKVNDLKARNGVKDISARRGVNGLAPHPTPSAAAMALVGIAARKIGPLPQQRKGSVAMWPSVHVQNSQAPDGQRSSQSSELPL